MSTEERSKVRINNEQKMYLFFSSPTVGRLLILLTSVAGIIRCEQHHLKFPKIHLNRNSQILKLPPVGQWVCDKSRDINLFTTTPHPPYLFYGPLGLLGLIASSHIYMSTEERSKGRINNGLNFLKLQFRLVLRF